MPAPLPDGQIPSSDPENSDQLLQLEVFIHDLTVGLVVPFTQRSDGTITAAKGQLEGIGLLVPPDLAKEDVEIPLAALPGVTYRYDDAAQTIYFTVAPSAQKPARISGRSVSAAAPDPVRPPFGAVVNYTLFASGDYRAGGAKFQGMSGAFETRVFGNFGLVENSFVGSMGSGSRVIRLDSTYSYEDPARLTTALAGDFIAGGFAWTRPIRMGGLQLRRSFGLRPDLVTVAIPSITGTAAAPSMLDLYINKVRSLSASVPQGPFEIDHPPIVYGSGVARIVLRDALGRETIASSAFYASPDLLTPGLADFSGELGFARRNYATKSNDYDRRLAFSGSYRRGISQGLTLLGHAEGAGGGLLSAGGGAVFTIGTFALTSVAVAASRTPGSTGALIDISIESRMPRLSVLVRSMRTFGNYEDLASWTAASSPILAGDRRIFGQPREIDQAALSVPLWPGASFGASYVRIRRADEARSRVANLSFTQDFGPLAVFASAAQDFEVSGSRSIFAGLSIPLGRGITASAGATHGRSVTSGFVEASRQGAHDPGAFGWAVRASEGQQREAQAIVRYSGNFARFEATGIYSGGSFTGTSVMEGALSVVGGELHATPRLDGAFALVEVGAPGVTVLRENRKAGVTGKGGKLLVPDLAAFVPNRISIEPEGLPVDARVEATETTTTPFNRVAGWVDLRVGLGGGSALVALVDRQARPIELGSEVRIDGKDQEFVVGYDGETYLEDLGAENVLLVTTPDGATCRASFHFEAVPGVQVRIGATVCVPDP